MIATQTLNDQTGSWNPSESYQTQTLNFTATNANATIRFTDASGTTYDGTDLGLDNIRLFEATNDTLTGGAGNDTLNGGAGTDIAYFSSTMNNYTITYDDVTKAFTVVDNRAGSPDGTDILYNIEQAVFEYQTVNLVGLTSGVDSYTANVNGTANYIGALAGNDSINGGTNIDYIMGGDGNDTLNGNQSSDTLVGGLGNDVLNGDPTGGGYYYDQDVVDYTNSANAINASLVGTGSGVMNSGTVTGEGSDTLNGIEVINGSGFNDTLSSSGASNSYYTTLNGGLGNDSITINNGNYYATGNGGEGNDTITLSNNTNYNNVYANGGNGDDLLISNNNYRPVMDAGNGNDTVITSGSGGFFGSNQAYTTLGEGNDSFTGGSGMDNLNYQQATMGLNANLQTGIITGQGTDTVSGVEGIQASNYADSIVGTNASLYVQGYDGNDTVIGGNQADYFYGGIGNDTLIGNDGNDYLSGEWGNNYIDAGNGQDGISDGYGNDTVYAGAGDDYITAQTGVDYIDGGTGTDSVYYYHSSQAISVNLSTGVLNDEFGQDTLVSIENITTVSGNDTITGTNGNNIINASEGNNIVYADSGDDTIYSGSGSDSIYGDAGKDLIQAGAGNDLVYAGSDNDTIYATQGSDTIYGGNDNDTVYMNGHLSDYTITQNGDGSLTFVDRRMLSQSMGEERIYDVENFVFQHDGLGEQTLTTAELFPVSLTAGADNYTASNGNDTLDALAGNDTVDGGDGFDYILGNDGDDSITGGQGSDSIIGGAGNDTLDGSYFQSADGYTDRVVYDGRRIDYNITDNGDGSYTVVDIRPGSPNGTDVIRNFEIIQFAETTMSMEQVVNSFIFTENDDYFDASGSYLIDATQGGNDNINLYDGISQITTGSGNDNFNLSGGLYTLNSGAGDDRVYLRGGDYQDSAVVTLGDGSDVVEMDSQYMATTVDAGAGDDQIYLNSGSSQNVSAGDGNDIIRTGWGNDSISAGNGDDQIETSEGNDTVNAGAGNDVIYAQNNGNKIIDAGDGNDNIYLNNGNNTLSYASNSRTSDQGIAFDLGNRSFNDISGANYDYIEGNVQNFIGSIANDQGTDSNLENKIQLGAGNDTLSVKSDGTNDTFEGGSNGYNGDVIIFENVRADYTITYDAGTGYYAVVNNNTGGTDLVKEFETFIFADGEVSQYDLVIDGDTSFFSSGDDVVSDATGAGVNWNALEGTDYVDGGTSNDSIYGGTGNDVIYGNAGNDTLNGGEDNDQLNGQEGDDLVIGGNGDDILIGKSGSDILMGGNGNDDIYDASDETGITNTFDGGAGDDTLHGDSGNDLMFGGSGNDLVLADYSNNAGDDTIDGGEGSDTMDAGDGIDTLSYATSSSSLNASLVSLTVEVSNGDIDQIANFENVIGSNYDDGIEGNEGDNVLTGGRGNDYLAGNDGSDTFVYTLGDGYDVIKGGESIDWTDQINLTGPNMVYGTDWTLTLTEGSITSDSGGVMTLDSDADGIITITATGETINFSDIERINY